MNCFRSALFSILLAASPALYGQATASSIDRELRAMMSLPEQQRTPATIQIAREIQSLPTEPAKLRLADGLCQVAEAGDSDHAALQAAADALTRALTEIPLPEMEPPAIQFFDLARLVRYEGVTTSLASPQMVRANQILAESDANIEKADFTLDDMTGKKYTLSQLRGKVVLIHFWSIRCPPCIRELPSLDEISQSYQSQGLIVLSITPDSPFDLSRFFSGGGFRPPVLLDEDGTVTQQFQVEGLPVTFVFNREGKLAAKSINVRTHQQFLLMLAKAGIKTL